MGMKVAKFGGSSVADGIQLAKIREIIYADPDIRYVVVSAPGKRFSEDSKITDLLYSCKMHIEHHLPYEQLYQVVCDRFSAVAFNLGVDAGLREEFDSILTAMKSGASEDFVASRGEYLNAKLIAAYLGWDFVDAAGAILFDAKGRFLEKETNEALSAALAGHEHAVIPGFYGTKPDGSIKTFSRGGSDITGSIVASAVGADIYENWTDVSGFLMADPRIVRNPREISAVTYAELRELSYMGASVLHEDAMFPVHKVGIPTVIRNTNNPTHPGTLISLHLPVEPTVPTISGIAGRKGFSVVAVEKAMMNSELGFGRKVLQVFEEAGVSFEHMPSGIDSISVVVSGEALEPHREEIVRRIADLTQPDVLSIHDHMAIIATVGRGMVSNCGTAARLFSAMSRAGINVRMIDQGSSELSIIVGVDDADFERTIEAIYNEFVG